MIAKPSIGELLDKMQSRCILVTAVSKRARQLASGNESLTKVEAESKVSVASYEIAEGKVYLVD